MSITADMLRGHTDAIILAQLALGDSYGYRINRAINAVTAAQYEMKEATLYTAFRRLEHDGLIRSYWGDENTGARRRYYAITPAGLEAYSQAQAQWQQTTRLINLLMNPTKEEPSHA